MEKMNDFFQCIQLPNVSEEDRYKFDTDITSEEVEGVICSLASGKACGPDGLPPEIYKSFKDILSPLLTRMPISVQNTDCKILDKLLASRVNNIIPKIVGHDQTGFVQNRQSYSNIRRLMGIIQCVKIKEKML
uniref:Reverse transcriptase domain-containing protein n=1 Tax=Lates calcarifer TaxID=8187 RepID=A0A4W6C0Q4_LATCA